MCAVLNASTENKDKLLSAIKGTRESGIEIAPPDIIESGIDFAVRGKKISFGLGGIKNLKTAAEAAVKGAKHKPSNLEELFEYADLSKLNLSRAQALANAGALDDIGSSNGLSRGGILVALEPIYEYFKERKRKEEQREKW